MATLTKEQYEALKRQGRGTYRGQTSSSGQYIIEADKFVGDLQGNADTATRLRDPITISLGGDAEGSAQFAGSSFRLDATIREAEHSANSDVAENANHSAQASHADLANIATLALRSMLADNASHAEEASHADDSTHADSSDTSTLATRALHADDAYHADEANNATYALKDSNGDNIHNTFVDKQSQITTNTNDIATHEGTLTNHEGRISQAESNISSLDTRVGNIETSTDVGRITQRIVNIEAKDVEQDGRLDAINDTMVTLSTAQYILSPKTFNAGSKTVMDNEAGATEITNKEYVDNKVLSSANYVTDNLESYTDNKVLSASRYMTDYVDNKVLSTSQYVDDNFMSLTKSQYVTGLNTYNTVLPQSNLTPTNDNDFITKKFFDENQSSGHALFDVVPKDHVLTYGKDLEGFAPLGTWVYKTAVDGSRYGYPDFVQKCLDEYDEATADTITFDNVTLNIKRHSNGHIYFDVADIETVNTYFNTYDHAWFYGIDETNERVFLPRQAHGKLIESYKNGSDWYRIYEDGFCEQGGSVTTASSTSTGQTVTFLKAFADTNVSIILTQSGSSFSSTLSVQSLTVNNFVAKSTRYNSSEENLFFNWQASGYTPLANIEVTPSYEYMVVGNVKVEQASTEVIDVTTTNNDTVPLFAPHYFDYTPNNLSWLKSGEQSNSGDLYKTCYNELVNVLNGETKYGALKVIDQADMVSGTDYSLYWIVNQTTETFRTPTATQQRFVVKTYQNGTDWYRIYNDGWCEQGGQFDTPSGSYSVRIDFLKPFNDANYYINGVRALNATSAQSNYTINFAKQITYCIAQANINSHFNWSASGYIDLTNEQIDTALYFKVANAVENIQMLNVGEVTEALTSKADTDLSNVPSSKGILVESYHNGTSWYRVYSDGWCEQGSISPKTATSVTIYLLKNYVDTNYTVVKSFFWTEQASCNSIYNKTSSSFDIIGVAHSSSVYAEQWIACGYIR